MSGKIPMSGLSPEEAARRLKTEGANELPSSKYRTPFQIALDLLREPMIFLLIACGTIYLFLGDTKEALLLLGSIGMIVGISLYQEGKTERALEALQNLSAPRALVLRGGKKIRIPSRYVVPGDLIVLVEGDRVPADARILSCMNLSIDESLLTGESVPVQKKAPGGEKSDSVFAGSLVVRGHGIAQAQATGLRTEMGKIGKSLQTIEREEMRLEKEIRKIIRIFASIGFLVCALVAVIYGMTHADWIQGFLAGLTLAISLVPEEFPVVLTVFLALGAWRISRQGVLTRRLPAIEMLGAATVLCVDKTGTLTMNRMRVHTLAVGEKQFQIPLEGTSPLPEEFRELALVGIRASQPEPFDPMEQALHVLSQQIPADIQSQQWTLIRQYPLSKKYMAMSQVWQSPDGQLHAAAKGAPEAIADLCRLSEDHRKKFLETTHLLASAGMRVLGVAQAALHNRNMPEQQEEFTFSLVGLIGLADPIRPSVPAAVQECRRAGIRVIMITGDYPETARQIGKQIGLEPLDHILTGKELDALDEATLMERIRAVNIFARIVPDQKLRLVNALKAHGEIVAMTGDGVNDAPALKSAHIGIAMGQRGTDVAREAAALVLLNDDFSSIVSAVRLGRRVFDNLRKAMAYLFAIHVPIAGMALLPVLFRWPLVLLPVHIVFLELIIDPACSIAFEAEPAEEDIMTRPPRNPKEPLFTRRAVILSLLQGLSVLGIVLAIYVVALGRGQWEWEARAMTFTTMIVANLALILTNRSWSRVIVATLRSPNPALWWVIGGALTVLGFILTVPTLRDLFRFGRLHPDDIVLCLGAGVLGIMWFEGMKILAARARMR